MVAMKTEKVREKIEILYPEAVVNSSRRMKQNDVVDQGRGYHGIRQAYKKGWK
jgi:hypothetical protein